jgi:cobalt-zinc-cadmium efflux system protein
MSRLHHHAHNPDHDHLKAIDHRSDRAFQVSLALNSGLVAVQVVLGLWSQSLALLADASHNLSDVLALFLGWGALRLARRRPSSRRTYGFSRTTILAALANAVLLFIVCGGILWEAVQRFWHPEPIQSGMMIFAAMLGIVINTGSALLFLHGKDRDLNLRGAFQHLRSDALVSLGVVAAGFAIQFTGWTWLDPTMSLVITGVILWGTGGLLRESLDLLLDAVPAQIDAAAVEAYLSHLPGVVALHDLHIWAMSTTEVALTAHLILPKGHPGDRFLVEAAEVLHHRFGISHSTLQIEQGNSAESCPMILQHH